MDRGGSGDRTIQASDCVAGTVGDGECDGRRTLYIVDRHRTVTSSLCHLPRLQTSRQTLLYTSNESRVAFYWTWGGRQTSGQPRGQSTPHRTDAIQPFVNYILKVEGQSDTCSLFSNYFVCNILLLNG